MVEQIVEKSIIDKFSAALVAANIDGIQILGAWQSVTAANGDVKAIEQPFARGYLSVKVSPRQFDNYVMSDGSLSATVELNIRAEADAKGVDYLTVTSTLSSVLYNWHKFFLTAKNDFAIANTFNFTGFRLDGGDCGIDRSAATWTWRQSFTIQGIFLD